MSNVTTQKTGIIDTNVYKVNNRKIYKLGNVIKEIYFKKPVRVKGCEDRRPKQEEPIFFPADVEQMIEIAMRENEKYHQGEYERHKNNVRRAKNSVYELAMCNEWEYFGTFTIDGSKYARDNLQEFYAKFSKWLNNYSFRHKKDIKYLLVPELHSDEKNWHMHGLIKGLTEEMLTAFEDGKHPKKLVNSDYKNWSDYEKKFGFCSFGKIKNKEKVSGYITKYVTKQLYDTKIEKGNHLYYASKGLSRRELLSDETYYPAVDEQWDFENDFVAIRTVVLDSED